MTIRIKICGVRTVETLFLLRELKVDFAGFIFHPKSPRNISLAEAATLGQTDSVSMKKVAVVVNPDDDLLENIMSSLNPDFIQLHGKESPERAKEIGEIFGTKIIKAFPVSSARDLTAITPYEGIADYFLFDAKPTEGEQEGGLGRSFDWTVLQNLRTNTPWFLAGGLDAANIGNAINQSGAKMVDISSGVEGSPGIKSEQKIREFVQNIRAI